MPEDEIVRARERFCRGSARSLVGSGLGLSIAAVCAERIGGALVLRNRAPTGLLVEFVFASQLAPAPTSSSAMPPETGTEPG